MSQKLDVNDYVTHCLALKIAEMSAAFDIY